MNIYTELLRHLFQRNSADYSVTSEDIKEYELINDKKSKLSANERRKVVYRVEKHLREISNEIKEFEVKK